MLDPQRLLKQVMGEALSGSLGGKNRKHHKGYGVGQGSGGMAGLGGLGGLLGGLAGGGSRTGGLSTATKAKIGMGALGVAIAAYEHFKNRTPGTASGPAPLPPHQPPPPPPLPPAAVAMPSPPPANAPAAVQQQAEAMHLLRAMICAANADGLIDADERARILGSANDAGLDADDIAELEGELAAPLTVAQLVARTRPAQREQVYVASVIAIGRDSELEERYLDDLARRLGIDTAARNALHAELDL